MAWLKIDDNAPLHRKILKAPPAARWLWICGLAYCQRLRTDGHVPADALATFGLRPADKPATLAHRLVLAGLWHVVEGGWNVHDFLDWNESASERDEKSAEKGVRQQKWREKKYAETRLLVTTVDASTPRTADATPPPPPPPTPTPRPVPQAPSKHEGAGRAIARAPLTTPSARTWGLRHSDHVAGFCNWMCLPIEDFGRFSARLGGDMKAQAWAESVKTSGVVPTGKPWEFWNAQFDAAHGGETRPTAGGFSKADWDAHMPGGAIDQKLGLA